MNLKKLLLSTVSFFFLLSSSVAIASDCEVKVDGYCHLDAAVILYQGIPTTSAPAISNSGQSVQYFDSTLGKLQCSEDGGAYADCVGGGGAISDDAYSAAWNGDTTTGASKNALYDKIETLASGSSKWTTNANIIHPNNSATDEVVIGGTTEGGGDIFLGADAVVVFNEQGNAVDFRIEGDTITNLFQIDGANDEVDINGDLNINLPADKNVTIDGRTNPRTVTLGAMRWNHTPEATTTNTRALYLDVDANSVPETQGMHINMQATGIAASETITSIDLVADTSTSSGGIIRGLSISKVGTGSAAVHGVHIDPEVDTVISHLSGTFGSILQGWDENGGFTDTTAAFNSSGTDVTIFDADNDKIYVGAAATFSAIRYTLNTAASNPGVKPTFEYSIAGPGWTAFTPNLEDTAGFRENGNIEWNTANLSGWASVTVNGQAAYYIRITRTQNTLGTDPIEDLIEISDPTLYAWDKDGAVNANSLLLVDDLTITSGTAGLINLNPSNAGNQTIIDIMPSAALTAGSVWNALKIDGNALDPATGAASDIHAIQADFSSFASVDGDATLHIIHFDYPVADNAIGVHSEFAELTNNSTVRNIYTDGGALVLSATATYIGHEADFSNMTRDAGAPVLQGIKVQLPADYTGFGTSYAGYFEGGGENSTFSDGTYAINATGPILLSGVLTSGGLTIGAAAILEAELEILDGATTTTTQLNYLNAATGTTGTTNTNLVFSTSPTLITPALGTPSALVGTNITGTGASFTAGIATVSNTSVIVDSTDATSFPLMVDSATGSLAVKTDGGLTYNASTGLLASTSMSSNLYDAPGAVDLDIGSVDVTDVTVTTDGGVVILDGSLSTSGGSTQPGRIIILEDTDDGANSTTIIGSATAANLEWILPTTNGTAGQVLEIASVASNTLTLEWDDDGGAGGSGADYLFVLRPQQAKLPTSNPMGIDAGNNRWRGLLDDTTSESATWEDIVRPFTGTMKAKIFYTAVSATSGTAAFDLEIDCKTDADAIDFDTESYGTADGITGTVNGTAGRLDVLSDASLNEDSCAEDDHITIKISRDVAADSVTGDLELRGVVIYAE